MTAALFFLLGCQLFGEVIRCALDLPLPGPIIGMVFLAILLSLRRHTPNKPSIPEGLSQMAQSLIRHMGLLFVPSGVGIIAEAGVLREEWLPIVAGLAGSTVLGLAVTGFVMHWTTRPRCVIQSSTSPPTAN